MALIYQEQYHITNQLLNNQIGGISVEDRRHLWASDKHLADKDAYQEHRKT
jgi:hypothetical protein